MARAQDASMRFMFDKYNNLAGQYLVIVIACLSLTLFGGYYFIQKKKYA